MTFDEAIEFAQASPLEFKNLLTSCPVIEWEGKLRILDSSYMKRVLDTFFAILQTMDLLSTSDGSLTNYKISFSVIRQIQQDLLKDFQIPELISSKILCLFRDDTTFDTLECYCFNKKLIARYYGEVLLKSNQV